jgi:hypothetical protein
METLRAASPLSVGDVTLVPVERVGSRSDRGDAGYWICGFKEVFAVVVCDESGVCVLAVGSSEIALDTLIQKTPNLGTVLSEISAS